MWANRVVAHAILLLGVHVSPFVWLYCRGGRLVFKCVMSGSVRSCAYVRPGILLVCAMSLRVVICCRICPLVVVLVGRGTLIGSASVASIA